MRSVWDKQHALIIGVLFFIAMFFAGNCYGWNDETHLAVAKAAGLKRWYTAVGADIAKIKAGTIEERNHYYNNIAGKEITPELVLKQAERYNDPSDTEGHLYGAIIGAVRGYLHTARSGKYAAYHLGYLAHYIADLAQPLHSLSYDEFNRTHHGPNDGVVDSEIAANIPKLQAAMYPITLNPETFEMDLAKEVARIANLSRQLGLKIKTENRDMTKEEAYRQLAHSASLLKAVLAYLRN